jgi:hypothetical protein
VIVSCWGLLAELDLFLHLHQSAILFSYVVCLAAFEFLLEMFKHYDEHCRYLSKFSYRVEQPSFATFGKE